MAEVVNKREAALEKGPATYADLEAVPPHLVAEIIGGRLLTHPRPSRRHVTTAMALAFELGPAFQKGAGGPGGWVFADEPELHLGSEVLVPDLAAWRAENLATHPETPYFSVRPDWLCEILSASTETRDRTLKMSSYGGAGVPHMWIIDPRQQILEAFELRTGRWTRLGGWNSADEVRAAPFDAVTFSLADLWPLDKPLGFNESPQPLYAGDR
ncbi:MAG TPA: Uma2 family endonuclease [Devosiaceae bacterium]|jgi:Uma2 family endonuclease|nr:Uma2 family endonuclease [Devosiaceae bacterium]